MFLDIAFNKYKKALNEAIELLENDNVRNEYQTIVNFMQNTNRIALNRDIVRSNGMLYAVLDFYKKDAKECQMELGNPNSIIDRGDLEFRIEADNMVIDELLSKTNIFDNLRYTFKRLNNLRSRLKSAQLAQVKAEEERLYELTHENVNLEEPEKDFLI